MPGIVIVTHGQLGNALIETAEAVLDKSLSSVIPVSADRNSKRLREKIQKGIRATGKRDVLILTDMFGGSASDMSYSFLKEGRSDVISAVNLPILLRAVSFGNEICFGDFSKCLEAYGKRSISLASEILKGNGRSSESSCPFHQACP